MTATERRHGMMSPSSPPVIELFSSDLDGTLLGNPESTRRFMEVWEDLPAAQRPLLVYNSGRTVRDVRSLVTARRLPKPQFIIGGVGTELHDFGADRDVPEFNAQFGEG